MGEDRTPVGRLDQMRLRVARHLLDVGLRDLLAAPARRAVGLVHQVVADHGPGGTKGGEVDPRIALIRLFHLVMLKVPSSWCSSPGLPARLMTIRMPGALRRVQVADHVLGMRRTAIRSTAPCTCWWEDGSHRTQCPGPSASSWRAPAPERQESLQRGRSGCHRVEAGAVDSSGLHATAANTRAEQASARRRAPRGARLNR